MATGVLTRNKVDAIQDYFKRQFVTEEGGLEENVRGLFSESLAYHVGESKSLSLDGLIQLTEGIRRTPKADRVTEITNLKEEGDHASFHLRIQVRAPDTGEIDVIENDHDWTFDDAGKAVDIRPRDAAVVERVLSVGAEPEAS